MLGNGLREIWLPDAGKIITGIRVSTDEAKKIMSDCSTSNRRHILGREHVLGAGPGSRRGHLGVRCRLRYGHTDRHLDGKTQTESKIAIDGD